MELTNRVKKYIEDNISLLRDGGRKDIERFINNFQSYSAAERICFLYVLQNVVGVVTDFDQQIQKVKEELFNRASVINAKYGVGGVTAAVVFSSTDEPVGDQTNEDYKLALAVIEDGSFPPNLDPMYSYYISCFPNSYIFTMYLTRNNKKNDKSCSVDIYGFAHKPQILEWYDNSILDKFFVQYEKFCQDWKNAIDTCIESFSIKEEIVNDYAPTLVSRMQKYLESDFGEIEIKVKTSGDFVSIEPQGPFKGRKSTRIEIPTDQSPRSLNIDDIMIVWRKRVDEFKEKELRKQINAINGVVKVTKKDIDKAIRAVGLTPSTTTYTNKYSTTTTYKYQFMDVDPDTCAKIKQELLNNNIPVFSVETVASMSWRGPYKSLFVKVNS